MPQSVGEPNQTALSAETARTVELAMEENSSDSASTSTVLINEVLNTYEQLSLTSDSPEALERSYQQYLTDVSEELNEFLPQIGIDLVSQHIDFFSQGDGFVSWEDLNLAQSNYLPSGGNPNVLAAQLIDSVKQQYQRMVSDGADGGDQGIGIHDLNQQLHHLSYVDREPSQDELQPTNQNEIRPASRHWITADGYLANLHPDLNLELRSYQRIPDGTFPIWDDDSGPNDPGAPQLASMFGPDHARDGDGLPLIEGLYQINDWIWDDANPTNGAGRRGGPIEYSKHSMLGFHTRPGENLFLPNSGYDVDSQGHQAQVLYVDHAKGEATFAYNLSGTVAGGYTFHLLNVDFGEHIVQGALVGTDVPLGVARKDVVLAAVADRGQFQPINYLHHWWGNRDPHP